MNKLIVTVLFISSLLTTGCFFNQHSYNDTRFLMDTVITISTTGKDQAAIETATQEAFVAFKDVADETDRYESRNPNDLYALNLHNGQGPFIVGEHLFKLLRMYTEQPYAALDLSLGPIIDVWRAHSDNKTLPASDEIKNALAKCGRSKFSLDTANHTVTLAPGSNLDLGSIAKGYAVDYAASVITKNKAVTSALINAGGNIKVLGTKEDGQPWRIGIQDPRNPQKNIGVLSLKNGQAVATSGDYQRYYEVDGVRYCHIIDPATGQPARNATSVTVVSSSALTADFFSTLLFVLPHKKAVEIVENTPQIEAIIVNPQGEIYVSPGLLKIFTKEN